mgnify:CR=1 FL=1
MKEEKEKIIVEIEGSEVHQKDKENSAGKEKEKSVEGVSSSEGLSENLSGESLLQSGVPESAVEEKFAEKRVFEGEEAEDIDSLKKKVELLTRKVEELTSEVEKLRSLSEEYKTKWIYTFSEYENYRRRVKNEIEIALRENTIKILSNFLNAIDSIDSALQYIKDEETKKGVELIRKIILDSLLNSGLKEIEVKEGEKFSPEKCEVISFEFSDELEEGTIIKVVRKGFEFNGRVVRPAQVVVAKKSEQKPE